jgi:hypothetical protein
MQNLQNMQNLIVCAKFAKLHKILLDNNNVSAKFAKLLRILLDKMVYKGKPVVAQKREMYHVTVRA